MQSLLVNTSLNTSQLIKKNISIILSFFAFSLFSWSLQADEPSKLSLPVVVVITQIVQHASLDQEYQGILAALKDAGYEDGKTMQLVFANAQGSLQTAGLIADKFASLHPTVAVAISTPSAQTLGNKLKDQKIPLVFTAVTDPLDAKLVTTLGKRPEAVTGVSDALLPGPQLELIQKLIPQVKTIGIVYNPGETNSTEAVQQLLEEAKKRGLSLVLATADKSSEVITSTNKLIGKVDAIYIPNDNTAVSSIEIIVSIGKKHKIPVFAGDVGSIERGAVAAQAYDRLTLGREAGGLVAKILKGEKAGDLIIAKEHPLVLMINLKSAQEMGVTIPEDMKGKAKLLGEKS
jgi:putative ABC transport system substrate-binding protein